MTKNNIKLPKIAILTPRFGVIDRGAESYTYELAKRLCSDFDVTVYARKRNKTDKQQSSFEKASEFFKISRINCITENNRIIRFVYKLTPFIGRLMDKFYLNPSEFEMFSFSLNILPRLLFSKYDLIFPNNGVWGAIICRIVKIVKGTPFACVSHGGIEPMVAKQKPDIYFVLSRPIFRWYKKYFPELNTVFIPTPVDTVRFHPKGEKIKVSLEKPIFITVAALIPVKGIEFTIRAISKLKKGSLLVVGQGPLKNNLELLAQKLLGKGRFLITSAKNSQMPKFYRSADIFTLAAQGEPGSVTPLEALSSNLPVVVNNEEHMKFIVGNGGVLVDTHDIGAYSKALEDVSEKNFENGPRKQALKFSWDIIAGKYYKLLLGVIKSDPSLKVV